MNTKFLLIAAAGFCSSFVAARKGVFGYRVVDLNREDQEGEEKINADLTYHVLFPRLEIRSHFKGKSIESWSVHRSFLVRPVKILIHGGVVTFEHHKMVFYKDQL